MFRKFLTVSLVALLAVGMLAAFGGAAQKSVSIAVVWSGNELAAFQQTVAPFEQQTGIKVNIESVGRDLPAVLVTRFQAGNPPDVAAMPNPGQMKEFAEKGGLVALENIVNLSDHPKAFVDLATVSGHVYGIFISADLKSLVWYNPKAFAAKGYNIPTTWGEMTALSDKIVADGGTPWCIGLESGAASGWPGTDWIEDIMLRLNGPDIYDKWVAHEIPWTSPAVYGAFSLFGAIARSGDYVYGGRIGALTINFGDSPNGLFTDPVGCYMHRQATFIQSFIKNANPGLVAGEDYDIFVLPPICEEGCNPLLGAGDLISAFNNTPEAQALVKYLASAEAQTIWVGALGKLAINTKVDPSVYPDPITAKAAEILGKACAFRFDGSDLMPAAVGSGTFWTGIMDYVGGTPLEAVLQDIEASAVAAY